jgi:RNA polymerase sigma-32 factor
MKTANAGMNDAQIDDMAKALSVKREDVIEMESRMGGADIALDPMVEDGEESYAPISYLADNTQEPVAVLEARSHDRLQIEGLERALEQLDARSRAIVAQRWLQVADDGSGGKTLHELAAEYGVSAERIRQIEVAAMKKMRKSLAEFA